MFDKNGDGMITSEELSQVMMSLGHRPTLGELKAFIRAVDTDREFLALQNGNYFSIIRRTTCVIYEEKINVLG